MENDMKTKTIIAALVLATATAATPLAAQAPGWNSNAFWQGAPQGVQQRIDWLQQRIDRGVQDGSLDRGEQRRIQQQLNYLRQQAADLNRRLDDLSRSIRWARQNDRYGYGYGNVGRDPYAIDYDAARYYRNDPRYQERRLGPNDQVYRGSDGRYYCRRSDGTTGLIVGGVGGALVGNVIDGGHNRAAGTLIGGALGALLGKTIDQNNSDIRCR
jgi:hypothetical protein